MSQIKTLLLDVGQVLVTLDYQAPFRQIMRYTNLSVADLQARWRSSGLTLLGDTGRLSTRELYDAVRALFQVKDLGLETFKREWATIFVLPGPEGQCVSPGLFRRLKRRHRLVAVSNTNELHWEYLETVLPLLKEFDDLVLSYRVGAMKPDLLIYRVALERAACRPDEALFVDDLELNIEAAARLGIRGLIYRNEIQFEEDLTRLGLLD
jgi:FMN phosphatase YigB (HAD superfamily)